LAANAHHQDDHFSDGIKKQINIRWIMDIGFGNKGITASG